MLTSLVAVVVGVVMIAILMNIRNSGPGVIIFFVFLVVAAGVLLWTTLAQPRRHVTEELATRPPTVVNVDEESPPPRDVPTSGPMHDRLQELETLHRDGLISNEEYDAKRRDVLTKW